MSGDINSTPIYNLKYPYNTYQGTIHPQENEFNYVITCDVKKGIAGWADAINMLTLSFYDDNFPYNDYMPIKTDIPNMGIFYKITSSRCSKVNNILTRGVELTCPDYYHMEQIPIKIETVFNTTNLNPTGKITKLARLNSKATMTVSNRNDINFQVSENLFSGIADINVSTYGCTLDTDNINFDLGKHQQSDFTRVSTKGNEIKKQINLTCAPNTKYSLQVDGDAEPNHPGVIKLTQEPGAATGVGVQLLTGPNKEPVVLGVAKEMGTTAASGTDIKQNIDITARYYQTAPTITPGSANASATYTMTYQ
ncbi:fimbrial protein [Yersinia mollaretii]|uniref:fimbrial protein n=1 Tax=Yersinia mollaretii TaxID=33060 RepID=UPI001FCC417A|nr:fimbrial protein [Yersinia mollaretii]MDA5533456.1 fimbrial protein [Yersinia mollaretii]